MSSMFLSETMQSQLPILSHLLPDAAYAVAGIIAAAVVILELSKNRKLDVFPTLGSRSLLESWWSGSNYQTNARELIQEGYDKYRSMPFKVADHYRWIVIVGDLQHIEELRKAPDDILSFDDAVDDLLKLKYTMGREVVLNQYHTDIIRSQLTRSISELYPEVRDEISVAFDEHLDLQDNEWKSVPALSTIQKVVCRVSNRVFVGLPLCRNPEWINIGLRYTLDIANAGRIIRRFPDFLAPIIARLMTDVPNTTKHAMRHLAPIIEERLKLQEEYGADWDGKPNDMLSWLLDEAPEGPERTVRLWTTRILVVNFASIHTSSNSFAHALFLLAEHPQYIQPLREEVESIVEKEGWSKVSLAKMYKIDSFLKEAQRLVGLGVLSLTRMAIRDFTFSDGTFIPKGTIIAVPSHSLHVDDQYYENPQVFNPFRFSDMCNMDGEGTKHHFVSTSPEYLPFGYGKHACPGRFFASNELKSMLAHIVLSYDVKLEDNKRPKQLRRGASILADPTAKVMFRRRAD